ncbi:MAG: chorismate mutase [Syntrophomonadaceae bacterium]|nr:chorismate mutase [Syntrophomonadaceae bacterium]
MATRGIRGAITISRDEPQEVLGATRQLLEAIVEQNHLIPPHIVSIIFTVTPDIKAAFPARAARRMGWDKVPLLCAQEIAVPDALPFCIRILLHVNTDQEQDEIKHVYLKDAVQLREDLLVNQQTEPSFS